MPLPPVTAEDKPAVEAMIKKLVRLRKREAQKAGYCYGNPYLDDAIEGLMDYGAIKGWWEHQN